MEGIYLLLLLAAVIVVVVLFGSKKSKPDEDSRGYSPNHQNNANDYPPNNQQAGGATTAPEDIKPIPRPTMASITTKPPVTAAQIETHGLGVLQQYLTEMFLGQRDAPEVLEVIKSHAESLITLAWDDYEQRKVTELVNAEEVDRYQIFEALGMVVDVRAIEDNIRSFYESGEIAFPKNFRIDDFSMRMDGGTKEFYCTDLDTNQEFRLAFFQFMHEKRNPLELTAGIYWHQNLLVPVRSETEAFILRKLRQLAGLDQPNALADINFSVGVDPGVFMDQSIPGDLKQKRAIYELCGFVEMDEYLAWAKALGRID